VEVPALLQATPATQVSLGLRPSHKFLPIIFMPNSEDQNLALPVVPFPGVSLRSGLLATLIFAYVLAIACGPILVGHDTWTAFSHVQTWMNALKAGDLLPVWTPTDANGFGSPVPFFYHKLFNLVAAALAIVTGDIVTGVRGAVLFFSTLMFLGTCACAARCGADLQARIVIGLACVMSPYAVACIVLRGAYAEYSAMALIPVCIALTLDFFLQRASGWKALQLFALLILVALAHLVTFIVAVALLLACALGLLLQRRWKASLSLLAASGSAAIIFVLVVYVPFTVWGALFCPGQARLWGLPADNTVPLRQLLSPKPRSWYGWPMLTLLGGFAWQIHRRKNSGAGLVLVIGAIAIALIVVMSSLAAPLWKLSDTFDFVQFPWRLLSIATPMIFLAFAGMLEQYSGQTKRRLQIALLVVTAANTVGLLHFISEVSATIPLASLRYRTPSNGPGPDAGGEYFPARYQASLGASRKVFFAGVTKVLPSRRPLIQSEGGCTVTPVEPPAYFRDLQTNAQCTSPGRVDVNQFDTPFLDVTAVDDRGRLLRPAPNDSPFFELTLPEGRWVIHVRQKRYLELVAEAWEQKIQQWQGPVAPERLSPR
jgi:6-pyruvoyl-tetrahydropterin synthase related domain